MASAESGLNSGDMVPESCDFGNELMAMFGLFGTTRSGQIIEKIDDSNGIDLYASPA
ncbi:hypothetical protein ACEQ8H_007871 [Pleosporales sp. CAS-2024a]